jgi:hypothetical protein
MHLSYIYKVLKDGLPDTGIYSKAIQCIYCTSSRSSSRPIQIMHLSYIYKGHQAGPSRCWYLQLSKAKHVSYIYKVLNQVHPDTSISNRGLYCHPQVPVGTSRNQSDSSQIPVGIFESRYQPNGW